ncbi:AbrB family transcriptional regulator [Ostreibacterium oceani]|uniref:AbrB family transcriptional regulator n=1 Tax=Ostreibacterium oceani TaxID=2654998 RepID=A0A6N7EUM3_9GAMM|nr:AbrB family transcriptional regulator [Ostreibacterium oceani]MPV86484.1 AbrB family transcriptional regulator [Ostreibacterium oceani]
MITTRRLLTLLLSLMGVGLFYWLALPLPFLFGPMSACLIASLLGVKLQGMKPFSIGARTVLGIAVGTAITPAILQQASQMAFTLLLIPIYIILIGAIGVPFYQRFFGYDRVTSFYAAMPGGASDMIIFGQAAGGNARALSLIHATRMLIIITIVPFFLAYFNDISLDAPIGQSASQLPWHEMAIMVVVAIIGWKGGEKIRLFGAAILGPLILSLVLSLGDILHHRPPSEAILVAQFFLGMGIGMHYQGITLKEIKKDITAGALFALILTTIAAFFALLAHAIGNVPWLEAIMAFSPGGQAEMTILAIVAGADLGFIVLHHLLRILLVILGAPLLARFLLKKTNHKV